VKTYTFAVNVEAQDDDMVMAFEADIGRFGKVRIERMPNGEWKPTLSESLDDCFHPASLAGCAGWFLEMAAMRAPGPYPR
jgi:hypothetical protein